MFDKHSISYVITKDIPISDLRSLYLDAGWITPQYSDLILQKMIDNSYVVSAAFHDKRLIGLMRALSDGVSDAYLLDLIVDRKFRNQGIGRTILTRLAEFIHDQGIEWILCIGATGTESFYQKTPGVIMQGHTPYRFFEKPLL